MKQGTNQQGDRLQFLGHLAGGLAHEIKNPLSTMTINLQLLKEDWNKPTNSKEQKLQKKINLILGEIGRLETILDDFLDFARGHKQNPSLIRLNTLIHNITEFVSPEINQSHCSIRVFEGENLPKIFVDPKSIEQAVINLIKNAHQAMPDGGEILISTRATDTGVQLQITDTGEGMTEEQISKIFNTYYSTKRYGTGLGLPTSKRIIEEHGGTITVMSEPGKGSSFTVNLPKAENI